MKLSKILGIVSMLISLVTLASTTIEAISPKYAVWVMAITGIVSALTKAVQEKVVPLVEEPETPDSE